MPYRDLIWRRLTKQPGEHRNDPVTKPAEQKNESIIKSESSATTVSSIKEFCFPPQNPLRLSRGCIDKPFTGYKPSDQPDREGSATEAKAIDVIARLVITAQKRVEMDNVALQPPPKCTAEQRQWFES